MLVLLPYYGHYINSAKPYLSRHVKVIYWFKEMDVALPPFFQKNIVVVYMVAVLLLVPLAWKVA